MGHGCVLPLPTDPHPRYIKGRLCLTSIRSWHQQLCNVVERPPPSPDTLSTVLRAAATHPRPGCAINLSLKSTRSCLHVGGIRQLPERPHNTKQGRVQQLGNRGGGLSGELQGRNKWCHLTVLLFFSFFFFSFFFFNYSFSFFFFFQWNGGGYPPDPPCWREPTTCPLNQQPGMEAGINLV